MPDKKDLLSPTIWQTRSQIMKILMTIEKLLNKVRQTMKCVINLHIDIMVLEADVIQLIDKVKLFNADLIETNRLDKLINALRDYNGPLMSHEWPYPSLIETTVDDAEDIVINS